MSINLNFQPDVFGEVEKKTFFFLQNCCSITCKNSTLHIISDLNLNIFHIFFSPLLFRCIILISPFDVEVSALIIKLIIVISILVRDTGFLLRLLKIIMQQDSI